MSQQSNYSPMLPKLKRIYCLRNIRLSTLSRKANKKENNIYKGQSTTSGTLGDGI